MKEKKSIGELIMFVKDQFLFINNCVFLFICSHFNGNYYLHI